MNRYFIPTDEWQDAELVLTGDEARHCSRVMRAQEGDNVEIFDGNGTSAIAQVAVVSRETVTCRISSRTVSHEINHPITLCQAIPKGGNMELIVQKAVELGVSKIQPLITAHTVARPESAEKKCAKWQRIALEACKQCGQNYLPEITAPEPYDKWLKNNAHDQTRLVAALDDSSVHLKEYFSIHPPRGGISLLVGPEGDFSPDEYTAAYQSGFQAISFGSIILRVETASLYGLSVIQHELSA